MVVGALDDQDAVVAVGVDEDRGHAVGGAGHGADVPGVDAEVGEVAQGVGAEQVVADAADHHDVGAELGRGGGLVGALAAGADGEVGGGQGFAQTRHAVHGGDQVDHVAADHGNPGTHGTAPLEG